MTKSEAEKVMGYPIEIVQAGADIYAKVCLTSDLMLPEYKGRIVSAGARSEKGAINRLVERVLKIHGWVAIKRQGGKCGNCGRRAPLQADHKIERSKDRDDRIENLWGLCDPCHTQKTKHRKSRYAEAN